MRRSAVGNIPAVSTAAPLAPVASNHEEEQSRLASPGSKTYSEKHHQHDFNGRRLETAGGQMNEKHSGHDLHRTSTSTSSTAPTVTESHDLEHSISRVSTDPHGNTYPERGKEAYLVVFGSFCGCMISLGFMNTLSTYTAYLTTHQLADLPTSTAGWVFGIYAFLSFFLGLQIGPLFDAFGPRCLGGTGTALVFTPSIAAIGHWFYLRRGTFTGVACVGGSLGGIIFPLTLQALFGMENIGWAWSQRILALINLPLAICANLFIKSRLPPTRPVRKEQILPDPRIFRDKTFALVTLAVFFVEWGLFVPISYLTNFALAIGVDETFSYQIIAIFNAGSCFGRWLPGLVADKVGRFNTMILTTVICWIGTFAFWLPSEMLVGAGQTARLALLIVFSLIFGFGSGAGISLVPVCVGQLCKTEEYGRYYATCYTIVSFATLTGIPLAGGLLVNENGRERYWGLILFTGMSYLVSTAVFIGAKMTRVGFGKDLWKGRF
ncbi:hypothetical protein LTR05_001426 [Lithohypha guttulata]|uniref:Major facilitator superfamily (MFS) profile domain-containing protein n=1 Tax=Lithohypha guttulata TaxID=1690604 RepID=A0AAN7YAI7_9EURO|nr:hypothetical protein LTR05_001426 [Lithohypha guttulata]